MKFLCLVYVDEQMLDGLSKEDGAALTREALAYDEELRKGGHFVAANALTRVRTAKSVRTRKGTPIVTDGPFVETKEQVGGFILIEAKDLDQAVEIAQKIPPGRLGGIEVRPIHDLT